MPPSWAGAEWSEEQTYNAFQSLDDEWTVIHHVPWQSLRNGHQGDGEADFVLLHCNFGILIVEVKGGSRIEVVDGTWYSWSRNGRKTIKNPFDQATQSKHSLAQWLEGKVSGDYRGAAHFGHFVVFPAYSLEGDISPNGKRIIICDQGDLKNPETTINRIARHWDKRSLTPSQKGEIERLLRPTVQIRRFLRDTVAEVVDKLVSLTNEQIRAMSLLRFQRRATIQGPAGSGKTVLATARARELDARGFRTAFLCYNQLLGERLKEDLADTNVVVNTFHGLCVEYADKAGLMAGLEADPDLWEEVFPQLLPEAAGRLEKSFDAIVVDEGQDFLPDWWTHLELLLDDVDNGILYVFADSNQNVFRRGWRPPSGHEIFPLSVNCRNTHQIAERVHALCEDELSVIGVDGEPAVFLTASTERQLEKALTNSLKGLITRSKLVPEQIMILSADSSLFPQLEGREFGPATVGEGPNSVRLESVRRFKGLEADAVILLMPGEVTEETKRLAYVGMSRARALLIVIGPEEVKTAIDWPSS